MDNISIQERIDRAEEMAKFTGKYHIPSQARGCLKSGKIVEALKILKRYGF